MNQLNDVKGILYLTKVFTDESVEFMIIDNGSNNDVEEYINYFLKPKKLNYIKNKKNIGLVKTYQQAYESCETDILTIMHNDVYLYEYDWNKRIELLFEELPQVGMVGLFGSQGVGERGERIQDVIPGYPAGFSNMIEAELHGMRMKERIKPCVCFDGFFLSMRMDMLRLGNGFDMRYKYHHFYDRDIALESIKRGYFNVVVDIPSHHVSGVTANRDEFQNWIDKKRQTENYTGDKFTHDDNMRIFGEKWKEVLPVYIENDFTFRHGNHYGYKFKGDAIKKWEIKK